jgi:ABC transporter substrate binding protein (PQQ-dependent alcohol dehydrogenase system)
MFHIAPSDAMIRDARARAKGATAVTAWDPALFRFGADTLNDRFRKRFEMPMTAPAWGSWFAVKVLWEASLRMKSADPRLLAEFLDRDTTQFDGHKGRPLSFRPWDHQLRQFLYARVGGKLVDVPQSATPETTSREFLDELGTKASATSCHFVP